ncbi:hypothetical protein evm_012985 [Chilo suppressalis]|nr:hypothetical protein evm_012985 [Chilo suppressalis]
MATFICVVTSRRVTLSPTRPPPFACDLLTTLGIIGDLLAIPKDAPCRCEYRNVPLYADVILPPTAAELPCGLGYAGAAAPLVAAAYDCNGPCSACVPVTSPFICTKLATPQCAELRAYAKPIIL